MNYELDGVCVFCKRATPISRNTMKPEGIVCCSCRHTKKTREQIRAVQRARLVEIEAERVHLLAELGELALERNIILN